MSTVKRISQKEILPYLEAINPLLAEIRKNVESMPECGRKKSFLLSLVNFEKKAAVTAREVSENAVMDYVNKHPEVLQKLAKFARTDEGAKEVAQEVVTPEEALAEGATDEQKTKGKKRRV